jgi:hypothetical protein
MATKKLSMSYVQAMTTIGLDIAKSIFQVNGVDAEGHLLFVGS